MIEFNIKKVLIATDISVTNNGVLQLAAQLANKAGAEIILFNVLEGSNIISEEIHLQASTVAEPAKAALEKQKDQLIEQGVKKVSYLTERGKPFEKILEKAIAIKADIIVMGTPRMTTTNVLAAASNTYKVVSKATCPVLSVQPQFSAVAIENILLPFHDKAHSREDVEYAIEIAKIYGATLHILGVSYDTSEEGVEKIRLQAEQIVKILQKRGIKNTVSVIKGEYDAKLIDSSITECKADMLIVMADTDKVSMSEYIVGPVLQQLINHLQIPVLTIQPLFNFHTLISGGENINAVDWRPWD